MATNENDETERARASTAWAELIELMGEAESNLWEVLGSPDRVQAHVDGALTFSWDAKSDRYTVSVSPVGHCVHVTTGAFVRGPDQSEALRKLAVAVIGRRRLGRLQSEKITPC